LSLRAGCRYAGKQPLREADVGTQAEQDREAMMECLTIWSPRSRGRFKELRREETQRSREGKAMRIQDRECTLLNALWSTEDKSKAERDLLNQQVADAMDALRESNDSVRATIGDIEKVVEDGFRRGVEYAIECGLDLPSGCQSKVRRSQGIPRFSFNPGG